jgi:hypothetical protein
MEEISSKLESFVLGIVAHTGRFRSIHKAGTEEGESDVGIRLSSGECCTQARTLVPLAILDGAQLLANFLDFHARYYPEVAIERPEYASLNG